MKRTVNNGTRYLYKICVVGDKSVGKHAMMRVLQGILFDNRYMSTIGQTFDVISFNIESNDLKSNSFVRLAIQRSVGNLEYFQSIKERIENFFKGSSAVVLTFDVTNPDSLASINDWANLAVEMRRTQIPFILIGTKSDLEHQVDEILVKKISQELNAPYYYVSSKKNPEKIRSIFEKIARMVHGLNE